jgi:hypothetical protein
MNDTTNDRQHLSAALSPGLRKLPSNAPPKTWPARVRLSIVKAQVQPIAREPILSRHKCSRRLYGNTSNRSSSSAIKTGFMSVSENILMV